VSTEEQETDAEVGYEESEYDAIARRAYEIFESGEGGTPQENWERAERELRDPRGDADEPENVDAIE
jgi:hypothetical protein